jgi:hypothetical protein
MTTSTSKRSRRSPEGATPTHQSDQENERIRREGVADSSGGSAERPDAKDEDFIESTKRQGPSKSG